MTKLRISLFTFFFLLITFHPQNAQADELTPKLVLSNGSSSTNLTDNSHYSTVTFNSGDTITVTASNGSAIHGIYILWDSPVVPYTLITDTENLSCGTNGFLHEYIPLSSPSYKVTITIPSNEIRIDGIRIFGAGELPHDVQIWNPPCEQADIMVVSSHADDEILFFGGVLTTYSYLYDADIQVVYMCEFWSTTKVREHEKLDGLWEAGIRFYPVCGNFYDIYSDSLSWANQQYSYDALVEYLVKQIRDSQPQVIVTHDVFGEYGHGFHMLTCRALTAAVDLASDATQYPESAELYGAWNTPKTYLHLYNVNPIKLDLRVPIEEDYAGRTALDILKKAYTKHVSQQGYWFYVSDTYEYSCADFGLYRSLVGRDTTNDLLCNLKTYKVQEAEEAARLEAERIAAEKAAVEAEEAAKKAEVDKAVSEIRALLTKKAEEERIAAKNAAEAARLEAERLAAEQAAEEAERLEAEKLAEKDAVIALHIEEELRLTDELAKEKRIRLIWMSSSIVLFLAFGGVLTKVLISGKKRTI